MCTPTLALAAAATAMSAGGSIVNAREQAANQKRMANASNAAAEAEIARQHQYQDEAAGAFGNTLSAFQPQAQTDAASKAATDRTAFIESHLTQPPQLAATGATPAAAQSAIGKTILDAFDKSKERARAYAKLGSYDDTMFGNNLALNQGGQKVGMVNNFAQGSSALLPSAQRAGAANAYRAPSGFGDLLKAGGSALGIYGAMGAPGLGGGAGGMFNGGTATNPLTGLRVGGV